MRNALKAIPAPTEAEIAARYKRDSAQYAATEKRKVAQLVVSTEAAAKAIRDEVAKGKTLDAAAREKGLAVASVGPLTQSDLASQTSVAVAQAAFSAAKGQLSAPARGGLGYYIMRVDAIDQTPGRSLDQVRSAISAALTTEKRNAALVDLSAKIEDEFDSGASLTEVGKELGIKIETTPEVIGNGTIFKQPGVAAPAVLGRALSTAFDMQEGEPQLAEIEPGKTFLIFDVSKITSAAPAPLAEIKDSVVHAWRRSEGDKKAKEAADRVMKLVAKGETVAAAMSKESVKLPPVDPISMDREQLGKMGGRVPPVLALMFSMAEGTVKRLEAPNDNGWFVVKLNDIEPGKLADDDPIIASAAQQLAKSAGQEYAEEFTKAASKEVGIERNEDAVAKVKAQLAGHN